MIRLMTFALLLTLTQGAFGSFLLLEMKQGKEVSQHYYHDGLMATVTPHTTTLSDPRRGRTIHLDHKSKTYRVANQVESATHLPSHSQSLTPLKKKQTLAGQTCELAKVETFVSGTANAAAAPTGFSGTYCIWTSPPEAYRQFHHLLEAELRRQNKTAATPVKGSEALYQGLPLKISSSNKTAQKSMGTPPPQETLEAVKISTQPFSRDVFQIPEGYQASK